MEKCYVMKIYVSDEDLFELGGFTYAKLVTEDFMNDFLMKYEYCLNFCEIPNSYFCGIELDTYDNTFLLTEKDGSLVSNSWFEFQEITEEVELYVLNKYGLLNIEENNTFDDIFDTVVNCLNIIYEDLLNEELDMIKDEVVIECEDFYDNVNKVGGVFNG